MRNLPENLTCYKETREFNEKDVPLGLLRSHRSKAGTWAEIVVLEGALDYRILEPDIELHHLDQEHSGVVSPQNLHEVSVTGPVRFKVRFYH